MLDELWNRGFVPVPDPLTRSPVASDLGILDEWKRIDPPGRIGLEGSPR